MTSTKNQLKELSQQIDWLEKKREVLLAVDFFENLSNLCMQLGTNKITVHIKPVNTGNFSFQKTSGSKEFRLTVYAYDKKNTIRLIGKPRAFEKELSELFNEFKLDKDFNFQKIRLQLKEDCTEITVKQNSQFNNLISTYCTSQISSFYLNELLSEQLSEKEKKNPVIKI